MKPSALQHTAYVAFLRGINVGGNKLVKMDDLKKVFATTLKLENVQTILASGNILFETPETNCEMLTKTIEAALAKRFGHPIPVIIRSITNLKKLAANEPFKKIVVTPSTRLYLTFLSEKPKSLLKIPYVSPEKDFYILSVTDTEICSVLTLSENRGTVDAMGIIEKEFGRNVTTRNWNTIEKILKKA